MVKPSSYRTLYIILLAAGAVVWCYASDENPRERMLLEPYLATVEHAEVDLAKWDIYLSKLSSKREQFKDDRKFLEYMFYRTHQVFLKRYTEVTSFDEIFTQGSYNCLSGTILYSVMLNHFGIKHDVIETNYHIFILAQTSKGEVLLETTDGLDGFVTSAAKIEERIKQYQENQTRNKAESHYQFSFDLFSKVSQEELIGLLYYNYAVESFNHQDLKKSVHYLSLATERYTSARIEEFSEVLLWTLLLDENINATEKQSLKKQLQIIRYKALLATAKF